MSYSPQRLPLLACLLLSSTLVWTVGCSANLPVPQETPTPQTNSEPAYRSDRFQFSFSHPSEFAVIDTENGVTLWTVEEYRQIQAGEYVRTELPPDINISAYPNPNRVPLEQWLQGEGREYFGILQGEFTRTIVAGREAIAFDSEALYLKRNAVLSRNDGLEVVAISLARFPVEPQPDEDRATAYQQAFEQILSTFQLESER